MSFENCFITTGHLLDQYKRDSTVRIGKWRWPPPKEQIAQGTEGAPEDETAEGFLEFKMRKLQERKRTSQMPDGIDVEDSKSNSSPGKKKKDNHASGDADGNDSFDTSGEIQGKILLILLYLVLSCITCLCYVSLKYILNCLLLKGIEWGEDDDDDFEVEENKEAKSRSEKTGKEQVGKMKSKFNCKYLSKGSRNNLSNIISSSVM